MSPPRVFGRWLPRNDWEGDDRTPGAKGKFVTCQDTAVGRMVAWATNGRIDEDGKVYREAVPGHDPNGITLLQAQIAVGAVAHLPLIIPKNWGSANVKTHLRYGRGLVLNGMYSAVPRAYRYQKFADFPHAMWVSHLTTKGLIRLWDPLNPDIHAYGRFVPAGVIWGFLISLDYICGYVPLQIQGED